MRGRDTQANPIDGIYRLPAGWCGKRLSILVVGAGGTGSAVLASLAQIAVALPQLGHPGLTVTVIDDDTVSPTNVGRQLFSPSDVGRAKAHVLVNRINLAYGLAWTAEARRFGANEDSGADLIIGCVDNRLARWHILQGRQTNWRNESLWLDCGNSATSGQVVLGAWHNRRVAMPSVAALFPETVDTKADADDDAPSCSMSEALSRQDLLVNRFMADAACNLLWQLLRHGQIDHHGVFCDLKRSMMRPLPIDPVCWERMGFKMSEAESEQD